MLFSNIFLGIHFDRHVLLRDGFDEKRKVNFYQNFVFTNVKICKGNMIGLSRTCNWYDNVTKIKLPKTVFNLSL